MGREIKRVPLDFDWPLDRRLGVWGYCEVCNWHGTVWANEEAKKLADEWEKTEPPLGDGYQVWETVSEGSPVSPVFGTPDELAEWLVAHEGYSWEGALAFSQKGWVPSAIIRQEDSRQEYYRDIESAQLAD